MRKVRGGLEFLGNVSGCQGLCVFKKIHCSSLNIARAGVCSNCAEPFYETCALVQLAIPFITAHCQAIPRPAQLSPRKRDLMTSGESRDLTDFIGMPRGAPDEYKARNQEQWDLNQCYSGDLCALPPKKDYVLH